MASKIGGWLLYFAVVAAITYTGWSQPLRYRFLTPQDIRQLEHPTPVPVPPAESGAPAQSTIIGNPTWRTSLDKGAH